MIYSIINNKAITESKLKNCLFHLKAQVRLFFINSLCGMGNVLFSLLMTYFDYKYRIITFTVLIIFLLLWTSHDSKISSFIINIINRVSHALFENFLSQKQTNE